MNKVVILLKIIFTASIAFLLQNIFPWWSASIAAFLIAFILYTNAGGIIVPGGLFRHCPALDYSGFFGIALLWIIWAFLAYNSNDGVLASRVAAIFRFQIMPCFY
ncbi:MAG: hypothetical protein U5K79_09135 [Cyclobacteriaceae bacterium]|nr:hypothetical protein [Cyclobacteriaceae bacterium]